MSASLFSDLQLSMVAILKRDFKSTEFDLIFDRDFCIQKDIAIVIAVWKWRA